MAELLIEKIRELIRGDNQTGLRDWQIAKKIGVSQANVTKWMSQDIKPTHDSLEKIRKAYDLSAGYFSETKIDTEVNSDELDDLDVLILKSTRGMSREEKRNFIDYISDQKLLKEIKKLKRA